MIGSAWRPKSLASWQHLRDLLHFASRTSLSDVLDFLSRRADALIFGFVLPAHAIGLYFLAARLTTTVNTVSLFVAFDLTAALLPRFNFGTPAFRDAAYRTLQFTFLFCTPVFIGVALLADTAIALLFGAAWSGAVAPLQIMCISSVLYTLILSARQVLNAAGLPGAGLRIAAVNAGLYLLVLLPVAPYGPSAAAAANGIVSALCLPFVFITLRRRVGLAVGRVLADQIPVWVATVLMCACVMLADRSGMITADRLGALGALAVKGTLGTVVFVATLRCLMPALWKASVGALRSRDRLDAPS